MCKDLVARFVVETDHSVVNTLVIDVQSGVCSLLAIVECLGPYLISPEVEKRCSGTELLSEVLKNLPPEFVSKNEGSVLASFLSDRIKDHHSIQPHVVMGMSALCQCEKLASENIHSMLRIINKEVHLQSLLQKDRRHYYNMMLHILTHRLQDCQLMGNDLVYCYMQAMDGEKDPRNLILAFQCVRIISQNIPLGPFAEDLFEVVACYFPIDFTPPPNDKFGITKEELILGLRECLSSSSKFAEFCLPMLLEKMTSSITSAKVDAFQTLTSCTPVYGSLAMKDYLGSFWSVIEREALSGLSGSVETAALDALTAIVKTLSTQFNTGHTAELQNFIREAFNDVQRHMREPGHRLAFPSSRLLETIASATKPGCVIVVNHVIPLLIELFNKQPQINTRRTTLEIMIKFIKIVQSWEYSSDENPLHDFREDLYSILITMVLSSTPELKCLGILGAVGMFGISSMLRPEDRINIAVQIKDVVLNEKDASVRKEAITALTYISIKHPEIIKEHVLPAFLDQYNQEHMETENGSGDVKTVKSASDYEHMLNVVASLSRGADLVQTTLPFFLTRIQKSCDSSAINSESEFKELQCTCSCLSSIVNTNENSSDECVHYFFLYLLPECIKIVCTLLKSSSTTLMPDSGGGLHLHSEQISHLCAVVRSIACQLNLDECTLLAEYIIQMFTGQQCEWVKQSHPIFNIHNKETTTASTLLLFTSLICSLRQKVHIPNLSVILHALSDLCVDSIHCQHDVGEQAAKCLCGLVNKYGVDGKINDASTPVGKIYKAYSDTTNDLEMRKRAFSSLIWLTKSTVLASNQSQHQLTDVMLQAMKELEFARLASDGFYVILNEYPDIVSSEMHANVKIMFRQRFFHMTMPKLLEGFNTSTNERKPFYLQALSYLLRFVPKQVLMAELPPVIPLLIQSLLLPDQPVLWLSTLNTLYDLIHDAPDTFHKHLDDLLPKLLMLLKYKSDMKVRIAAVQCIGIMSTFPTHLLLPNRKPVLRELGRSLDDHKRRVRQEVAKARSEWFLVGEPGE